MLTKQLKSTKIPVFVQRATIENLNVVLCVHVDWWHHIEEYLQRILGGFIIACDGETCAGIRCMLPSIIETSYCQTLETVS